LPCTQGVRATGEQAVTQRGFKTSVAPGVLTWARETAGMAVADVASRLRIRPDTVAQWEAGARPLSIGRLERLADLYKRPLAAMLLPAPPSEPAAPHDFRALPGEKKACLTHETLLAIREATRIQGLAAELAVELGETAHWSAPAAVAASRPDALAVRERERLGISVDQQCTWGTPAAALKQWRHALERANMLVLQFAMPMDDARGFSLPHTHAPVIVINARDAVSGRVFTLFHEYGHLLLGSSALCIPDIEGRTGRRCARAERFCNEFAGAFLVPSQALADRLGEREPDNAAVGKLAARFGVSRHVILHRLRRTGRISEAALRRAIEALAARETPPRKRKAGFAQPPARRCLQVRGELFPRRVVEARARDLITASDAADYLSLRVRHFDRVEALLGEG